MKRVKDTKQGQNVMSFRGLQLIRDLNTPYLSIGSIRNTANVSGTEIKQALTAIRVRQHRVLVSWGTREFHTTCIRLKDLPAVDKQLGGKLGTLVEEIFNEYRNLI
jgi:hypothetical protein